MTKNDDLSTRVAGAARRTNVIQIRVNDDDWAVVTAICDELNLKPSALVFEFFQYALEQYARSGVKTGQTPNPRNN